MISEITGHSNSDPQYWSLDLVQFVRAEWPASSLFPPPSIAQVTRLIKQKFEYCTSGPSPCTCSHPAMPTVLSIVLSLFGLFLLQRLLDLRRVVRDVGFVCLLSDLVVPELTQRSNLPGPFYLFRATSAPGQLMLRFVRPARYLNLGANWSLDKKHEGTDR